MAPLAMPSIARIAAISPFIASPLRQHQGSYFHWPLTSRTITSARSSTP